MPDPAIPEDKQPQEVKAGAVPNLDQVNDLTQHMLEKEDNSSEEPETPAPSETPEAPVEQDADKEAPAETPAPTPAVPEPEQPPAPTVDTESTKPGPGKIAVKAFDGKYYYFNNLDEVPDDFEPASYKGWGQAVRDFTEKAQFDRSAAEAAEKADLQAKNDARIKAIQDGWDKDITKLTDSGGLPKDGRERKGIVNEVYDYIGEQLKQGVVIDSFEQAWKAVNYDKLMAERAEEQSAVNEVKKQRGGQVQAGGTAPASKPTIREGMPPGLSLDAVHNKVLESL